MALPSSGPISIGAINAEFGFASNTPRSMSQLYRNGGIVGAGAPNVPTSGAISLSQFYGAANQFAFTISSNQTNADLRSLAVAAGWDQNAPLVVTINSGVYISSNSTGTPALTVSGSFPGGVSITNNGFIVGMGGAGGVGGSDYFGRAPAAGSSGGTALSTSVALTFTNNGTLAGGGGGGGGGGGVSVFRESGSEGGGSIFTPSYGGGGGGGRSSSAANSAAGQGAYWVSTGNNLYPANNGSAGTFSTAGSGGTRLPDDAYSTPGGSGGTWGAAGTASTTPTGGSGGSQVGKPGGSGGAAASGNSNITWLATGTRYGALL